MRETEQQREERKEMKGGAEGGRKGDNQRMKMAEVTSGSDQTAQTSRLSFCQSFQIDPHHVGPHPPSLCCSLKLSASVSIFPATGLHSFAINRSLAVLRGITG